MYLSVFLITATMIPALEISILARTEINSTFISIPVLLLRLLISESFAIWMFLSRNRMETIKHLIQANEHLSEYNNFGYLQKYYYPT